MIPENLENSLGELEIRERIKTTALPKKYLYGELKYWEEYRDPKRFSVKQTSIKNQR